MTRAKDPANPGKKRGAAADTAAQRLRTQEARSKAWQLRLLGFSMREIGAQLGIGKTTAHRYIEDGLAEYRVAREADVGSYVALQTARLERLIRTFAVKAGTGSVSAAEVVIKAIDKINKLQGLEAPSKIAPTNPDGTKEFEGGGVGLAALLLEARAKKK